ncbi:HNH/endonuclease VII fold toxin-2 domain-containing protein [Paraburkholderia sp. IMGN_8]|uniref:HNH/endonuclease VII fold toxin-2 domain-containing protein n=1 Tax=Paraburkholderia sp. IMGN_8 TaxID=3136564 RepID=UPI003101172B
MSNEVYANMMEVSCKQAAGKSICAFPDVCMTPPTTPATPPGVPVPYPNTGLASDTSDGSTTVMISGQEVMLKNKSYFKKSTGDEAGAAPQKGVVTHKNMGKVYFTAWSMDVKFEGENVVRMLDTTTHNHGSVPGNTPVWPYIDEEDTANVKELCAEEIDNEKKACKGCTPYGKQDPCTKTSLGIVGKPAGSKESTEADTLANRTAANKCLAARRCALQPYKSAKSHCCPQQTGHHLIEASALHNTGRGGSGSVAVKGMSDYSENMAPCVCAEGVNQNTGTHGLMHTFQSAAAAKCPEGNIPMSKGPSVKDRVTTYGESKESAAKAHKKTFPESQCTKECITAQLDAYHNQCGVEDNTKIKAVVEGQSDVSEAAKEVKDRSANIRRARAAAGLD